MANSSNHQQKRKKKNLKTLSWWDKEWDVISRCQKQILDDFFFIIVETVTHRVCMKSQLSFPAVNQIHLCLPLLFQENMFHGRGGSFKYLKVSNNYPEYTGKVSVWQVDISLTSTKKWYLNGAQMLLGV